MFVGECIKGTLSAEDISEEDKSTNDPPALCWSSGPVAENRSKSERSAGSGVLQAIPCCDSSASAVGDVAKQCLWCSERPLLLLKERGQWGRSVWRWDRDVFVPHCKREDVFPVRRGF